MQRRTRVGEWVSRTGVWVVVGVLCLLGANAWGASAYLTEKDWQYQDLDKLSRAGLLVGHPAGPLSVWTDRLSRYEAAALTMRAVQGIGQAYEAKGERLQQLAQVNEPEQAAPATEAPSAAPAPETAPATPGFSSEDLLRTQKLVEEFRTELVGMGERLDEVENSLKLMLGMVTDLQKGLDQVAADQKKHKLSGYIQARFSRDDATAGRQNFFIKGARVNVQGPLSPKTAYRVEMQFDSSEKVSSVDFAKEKTSGGGPGSKAQLRTASIDYKLSDLAFVRGGQVILPFGYELEESTPDLWTGDRSVVMDRLFPDQRDLGAFTEFRPQVTSPLFDVGVFNGTGIDTLDNNERVNVLGRVKVPFAMGSAALSAYNGENGAGPTRTRQDRYGVGTKLAVGQTQLMGEVITGKDLGHSVRGWYAQAGRPILTHRGNLLFAKYDTYNENRGAPDQDFRRWSLGYWYEFDPATRLTLVWELRDVGARFSDFTKWNGNAEFLQLQVKF